MTIPRTVKIEYATVRNNIAAPTYGGNKLRTQDETLLEHGGNSWRQYDAYSDILKDCHVLAVTQKRWKEVTRREVIVAPGGTRRIDKMAAEMVQYQIENLSSRGDYAEGEETTISTAGNFDTACEHLLAAIHYGFSPAEIAWDQDGKEVYVDELLPKDLRRFFFVPGDRGYKMRMHDPMGGTPNGIILPHRKFVVHRCTMRPTEAPEGLGLAHALFYPAWFKRQDIKFWLAFADKFASPTAIAQYKAGTLKEDERRKLEDKLADLSSETGMVVSDDVAIKFLEAARSSTISVYSELVKFCDGEISKATLGETGTTDQQGGGGSRARDEVGNSVRIGIAKADSDLLSATLNRTLARWITWYNYGDRAAVPRIWRRFPELEGSVDHLQLAQRDNIIVDMSGRKPTDRYLRETYDIELEEPVHQPVIEPADLPEEEPESKEETADGGSAVGG